MYVLFATQFAILLSSWYICTYLAQGPTMITKLHNVLSIIIFFNSIFGTQNEIQSNIKIRTSLKQDRKGFQSPRLRRFTLISDNLLRLASIYFLSIYFDLHQFTLICINLLWSSHFLFTLIEGQKWQARNMIKITI